MERVLLTGGRIFTLDAERPEAEALYVEKGRIVAAGDREEVELQHGRAGVRRIDLQGGFAVPGLVDSHLHLAMSAEVPVDRLFPRPFQGGDASSAPGAGRKDPLRENGSWGPIGMRTGSGKG